MSDGLDLDHLLTVARATATNGQVREWFWQGGYPQQVLSLGDVTLIAECYENPDMPSTMAEFIATFDPRTVEALIMNLQMCGAGGSDE
jgi:hypothetical protein